MRLAADPPFAAGTRTRLRLRRLRGEDELALDAEGPEPGNSLLARLLVPAWCDDARHAGDEDRSDAILSGAGRARARLASLGVSERDGLLATLFVQCYGDEVVARHACLDCGAAFEFTFSLGALQSRLAARRDEAPVENVQPDAQGRYTLRDGTRFRLPLVADLDAVADAAPEVAERALLLRCCDGDPETGPVDAVSLQAALEALAPVLSLDLAAACPECGAMQAVPFDIERFLVDALSAERRILTLEIHRLASAYRWSLTDILRLERADRRALVARVESEGERGAW